MDNIERVREELAQKYYAMAEANSLFCIVMIAGTA